MEALAGQLASVMQDAALIFLHGELGAGKTTFVRGFLRQLGYTGAVKSPTYTLVEPYALRDKTVYHFDLYRLTDPEELEAIGVRDYFDGKEICLLEWPERGQGCLPEADIDITMDIVDAGREVCIAAVSASGQRLLGALTGIPEN
ncbi:MAG: tRNA (adenosine(37)-N6)-threonylcarbamoyltransferase complex ATPase subunit type 1 TsaE [Thiotrichales bacterium]|nr:tRNA (adenosine(37)-N6)-threonylcarbamoyltransferase complex ATPase subunit type 1 TsaE [Thiotrichales bacterium]